MSEQVKKRMALLKQLRAEHQETVARTQAYLQENKRIHQQIHKALQEQPRTAPQVAEATGLPVADVLWHITAMRKYGQVIETGKSGDYYLYQTAKDTSK
jgi:predicted transcriptional regulator